MRSAECGIARGGRWHSDAHIDIPHSAFRIPHWGGGEMLSIDLRGKRALVAGVADDGGDGFSHPQAPARGGGAPWARPQAPPPEKLPHPPPRGQKRRTRPPPAGPTVPVWEKSS